MTIKRVPRVNYEKNPLVEVVCQFTFQKFDMEVGRVDLFRERVKFYGYTAFEEKQITSLVAPEDATGEAGATPSPQFQQLTNSIFTSENEGWRVSFTPLALEVSTSRYQCWEEFKGPLMDVVRLFAEVFSAASVDKISLRYKDVFEREALGLEGVQWRDLLAPFVAGVLSADIFEEESSLDGLVGVHNAQSLLHLPECQLLLQSALLHSVPDRRRQAFLIDSDFFVENASTKLDNLEKLHATLDVLHDGAGALFRNCITGRLHDALRPKPL